MGLKFWQDKAELAPAHQVSAFEVVEVEREWVGHYACNVLDANVVIGSYPHTPNFYFMGGFSGHRFQ